ncbi:MAG: hypothetical protein ACI4E1_07725 [Lachnospira sp.]
MRSFEENERMKAALEEIRRNCSLRWDCENCPLSTLYKCSADADKEIPAAWKFEWDKEGNDAENVL